MVLLIIGGDNDDNHSEYLFDTGCIYRVWKVKRVVKKTTLGVQVQDLQLVIYGLSYSTSVPT
jgi:hypothetical protein